MADKFSPFKNFKPLGDGRVMVTQDLRDGDANIAEALDKSTDVLLESGADVAMVIIQKGNAVYKGSCRNSLAYTHLEEQGMKEALNTGLEKEREALRQNEKMLEKTRRTNIDHFKLQGDSAMVEALQQKGESDLLRKFMYEQLKTRREEGLD